MKLHTEKNKLKLYGTRIILGINYTSFFTEGSFYLEWETLLSGGREKGYKS